MGRYRFGPLGRLMVIDTPDDGLDNDVEEFGGIHQTLNATRTKDVTGYKATVKIKLEGLDARALSWFEMAYRGALGEPLYWLDEQRLNRLSAAASSARSAWSELDPYSVTSGTKSIVANTALLLPGVQDGVAVQTPGPVSAITWVSTIGATLRVGDPTPVQPGEHLVFSVYALAGTPTVEWTPYDATLTPLAQAGATTVVAGSPPRRYTTYTVPGTGVAAVRPVIRHAAAGTSTLTAMQLEQGDTPTPWVLGNGVPQMLVESFPTHRRKIGNYADADLVLLEV